MTAMSDLRFLARRKALAAVAVVTMGLAIGATSAALSVLKTFLFSSLGVPDSDRVVTVQPERDLPGRGAVKFLDAYPNYLLLRETQRSFVDVAAMVQLSASWDDGGEARQLAATLATATFVSTFRAQPMLGRWFSPSEEGPSPAAVIVVSHGLWENALGADRHIIGKTLSVNGAPHTVIGVMNPGFDQPTPTQVWLPFDIPPNQRTRITGARQLSVFGRLKDGTTFDGVQREMQSFTARALEAAPADNKDFRYTITTMRETLLGGADETALFVLAGAVGLMLLAVLNLSSLLIAWGFERQREFAVRIALGADARHVTRLMLRQSLVVVAFSGVVGLGLSVLGLRLLQSFDLGPTVTPFLQAARLDPSVLIVTLLLTGVAGVAAGLLPACVARGARVGESLRATSRSTTMSRGAVAWQKATVLTQSALSVLILATAALIAFSFWRLADVPDGFATSNRFVAKVVLPDTRYASHTTRAAFGRALSEHLAAEPGLASSGFSTTLPVGDIPNGSRFLVELPDGSVSTEPMLLHFRRTSPSYLGAMGIPLLRGRAFSATDDTSGVQVAIVSRALADRLWPQRDAIGARLVRAAAAGGNPVPLLVVGVAGNTMDGGYSATPGEAVYVPFSQISSNRLSIVAESRGNSIETVAAIKRALRKSDLAVAAGNVATLETLVLNANALPRLRTVILLVFAVVALGVVSLGMYGVMSQLVSTREREFALRLVFGARPSQLAEIVALQVARIAVPGIAIGLLAAWLFSGTLRTFLFGIAPTSISVFSASGALLLGLSIVATIPCALRAMRIDVRAGTG
jgi:putative ABC transport system permease protein